MTDSESDKSTFTAPPPPVEVSFKSHYKKNFFLMHWYLWKFLAGCYPACYVNISIHLSMRTSCRHVYLCTCAYVCICAAHVHIEKYVCTLVSMPICACTLSMRIYALQTYYVLVYVLGRITLIHTSPVSCEVGIQNRVKIASSGAEIWHEIALRAHNARE